MAFLFLCGTKKMVAISECGSISDVDNLIKDSAAWWWFMPWYGDYTRSSKHNSIELWKKMFASNYVITLDEMPSLKQLQLLSRPASCKQIWLAAILFYFHFMLPVTIRLCHFYLLAFCFCCLGCFGTKQNSGIAGTLAASELQPVGRTWLHGQQGLELISSAAYFGFQFKGTACTVYATVPDGMDHNYIQYSLDGKYGKRLRISGKVKTPIIINAEGSGLHQVWIYKATEAHTGPVYIQQIRGKSLQVLRQPDAPLIEFIGNSITCGAAADPSEVPCGTGEYHDQHNAYFAYGPRVARALKTNFILSSVSGIGIYRNWNSDGPTMPQVYESAVFGNNAERRWDFNKYNPRIVSIALGTNDFSNGDGIRKRLPFDSALFVSNYIQFVGLVKSKYPTAQIALLSSPMIKGAARAQLQNCLLAVKQKTDALNPGQKVSVFFFKPMDAHGCTGHPNVEDHTILASELEPFFSGLLK